jgi:PAS domain S-box-containing protein
MPRRRTSSGGLAAKVRDLGRRLAEAEEALRAARCGGVDAPAVDGPTGERIDALEGAEHLYRVLVERMNEGAAALDAAGLIRYANGRLAAMLGRPPESLPGSPMAAYIGEEHRRAFYELVARGLGEAGHAELELRPADGPPLPVNLSIAPLPHDAGGGACLIVTDLSERRRDQALRESEAGFRQIVEGLGEIVWMTDPEMDRMLYINPAYEHVTGRSCLSLHERPSSFLEEVIHPDDVPSVEAAFAEVRRTGEYDIEYRVVRRDSAVRWLADNAWEVRDEEGKVCRIVGVARDVTERRRVEEAMGRSEARHRRIVETACEGILTVDAELRIDFVNRRAAEMLGFGVQELLGRPLVDLIDDRDEAGRHLPSWQDDGRKAEIRFRRCDGSGLWAIVSASPFFGEDGRPLGDLIMISDITARVEAERERALLADRNRLLLESTGEGICGTDAELRCNFANSAAERLLGFGPGELIGRDIHATIHHSRPDGEPYPADQCPIKEAVRAGRHLRADDDVFWRRDGIPFPVAYSASPIVDGEAIRGSVVTFSDITERRKTEEDRDAALRERRAIMEAIPDILYVIDLDGRLVRWNGRTEEVLGLTGEALRGRSVLELVPPDEREAAAAAIRCGLQAGSVVFEGHMLRPDGTTIPYRWTAAVLRDGAGNLVGLTGTASDITRQKQEEEEIRNLNARLENKVHRLAALRRIDAAIAATLPLQKTLGIVLDKATALLGADAASVLLLDPDARNLEWFSHVGFRTEEPPSDPIPAEQSAAGRAALEHRSLHIPDLRRSPESFIRASLFECEGFIAYHAVPLMVEGRSRGLLEVFRRSPFEPDPGWIDFLENLAGQAAVAVETAGLIESLNRTNAELMHSYDTTIEAWARVLDLRDRDTEGHTRRVTDMTVRLARALGVGEAELVHIRRGATLHDIGKMGIPDSVLHKPGPLTDEEWALMRRHPELAHEWLAPIDFLGPALEIPYCHHEKWDGSGYPRGLRGEQIPLAARIFAVADIWDALSFDRPYRAAWPAEKVRAHIASLSGSHLDPRVVAAFLEAVDAGVAEA